MKEYREFTYKKDDDIWNINDKITEAGIVLSGSVNIIKEDGETVL